MEKHLTRNKLLESIDGLVKYSRLYPVAMITVCFTNENGAILWRDTVEFYTLDEVVSLLMDKSVFYRIVAVKSFEILHNRICVNFTLSPDKERKTNIDIDFMEKLMKLEMMHDDTKKDF